MADSPVKYLSKTDLEQLDQWLSSSKASIPNNIYQLLTTLLTVYSKLLETKSKAGQTLNRLREAMGISPKSESSRKGLPLTDEEKLKRLVSQRKGLNRSINQFKKSIGQAKGLKPPGKKEKAGDEAKDEQLSLAVEDIFSHSLAQFSQITKGVAVNREGQFSEIKGLHSSHDTRIRRECNVEVSEITYRVETVTDLKTGKTVTASMDPHGPPGFEVTWAGLVNIVAAVIGYAIPINRLASMLKPASSYFSSARISSLLIYVANLLEPIYRYLGESLADTEVLSGDDTSTKVIEIDKLIEEGKISLPPKSILGQKIAKVFGRVSLIKNGTRPQKQYQVSLLTGKTNAKDPKSYIFFFHSHFGHLGNLLTKILEMRLAKNKKLVIQGDLSSSNKPSQSIQEKFDIVFAGCMAHCRRPFYRYRFDDPLLCFNMLRGFVILGSLETRIDNAGRTRKTVSHYRGYSLWVWKALYNYAIQVVEGDTTLFNKWPKSSELHKACAYLVNHFDELTAYCHDPRLELTNNFRERLLRWEKVMLDSSKFRKTEQGRLAVNILRTIVHTASAAQVNLKDYLLYVFQNFRDIEDHPEKYTPYAYSQMKSKS